MMSNEEIELNMKQQARNRTKKEHTFKEIVDSLVYLHTKNGFLVVNGRRAIKIARIHTIDIETADYPTMYFTLRINGNDTTKLYTKYPVRCTDVDMLETDYMSREVLFKVTELLESEKKVGVLNV